MHHDTLGSKKWCSANLTSWATQCICATTCYPMCYDPFDCICKLVNNLSLDGKHKATTQFCHSFKSFFSNKQKTWVDSGWHYEEFWLKIDQFRPKNLELSVYISISFTLLDNWNGSLHLIKHKQNAKISYSFILYPVSSITPSSHNHLYFHFSNFNTSFPQKYHHTSLSPVVHYPHSLSNYIT